jgi:serine protease Do
MRIAYLQLSLLGIFCHFFFIGACQDNLAAKKVENLIAKCVDKAMATSVYIIEYDTLKNKVQDGIEEINGFTGVVVSAEGHILTVSHAATPNQVYRISFPDGSKHIAIGLGRIGIQDKGKDYDMAMVKILKPGKWPFAQMARSTGLKLNQPVISIAYPGAFFKQTPNVRFGRITDVDLSDGFIESTAKMEPGDSGGPLFDELGRVVGIHSWIKETEDQNLDVPADHFLKYWTALNIAQDYKEFPAADDLPTANASVKLESVPPLEEVVSISSTQSKSVGVITSSRGNQQIAISGTAIDFSGTTYILSKNSMVANNPILKIDNKTIPVTIIKRDQNTDLVLLKTTEIIENGIQLKTDARNPVLQMKDIGKILISPLSNGSKKVGILSAGYTEMPLNTSKAYLGANTRETAGKITLGRVSQGSPVAAVFKQNDQVTKINGVSVTKAAEYNHEIGKYLAGDSITVNIIREGNAMQVNLFLSPQPIVRHVSFEFPGGRSARSDGFKNILIHDAAIRSDECGGPVFDSAGEFYGINIARRSRTSSIIMPVAAIVQFIKKS